MFEIQWLIRKLNSTPSPLCRFRNQTITVLLVLFGLSLPTLAQHSITGRVINEDGEPLIYAQTVLLNPADSTLQYFDVADDQGIYEIKRIKPGQYLMQFSFAAKETIYKTVTIPSESGENLGATQMKPALTENVVVTAEYVPIAIKSDTLEFNAKAFNTKPDAVVEDLLKKIPGVEVDKSGNVKAMGEDVTQVLVDGKEFFGKDTKVATKNLTAKAVDKVQVYDKKSEEAQFTGIDDGVRERTIDLLLNEDHKKGYFGRMETGAGTGKGNKTHYKAGGKVYRFSSKLQSALLGNINNINEFGYAREDQKEWGKQVDGLNTTGAAGLNLSYNADAANRYFASYLGSLTHKDVERLIFTQNFLEGGSYNQNEIQQDELRSMPHKINFGVRHNFNRKHKITLDGDVRIKSDNSENLRLISTGSEDSLFNTLDQVIETESDLVNGEARATCIAKLSGDKTQIKTDFSLNYNKSKSFINWRDELFFTNPDSASIFFQSQENKTDRSVITMTPTLIQKLSPFWILSTSLHVAAIANNLERQQDVFEKGGDLFVPVIPDFGTSEREFFPALSLRRNTAKHQIEFRMRARVSRFDKNLQNSTLPSENHSHWLPAFSYENFHKKGRRINFRYHSTVNMPSAQQLYPVTNTANLLSLYTGNPDLTPEEWHNAHFSYWMFDYFSFTSAFVRMSAGYTKNKISYSQFTNKDLTKTTTPVNTPYHYNISSFMNFSTPIRLLGLKINTWWHENWSKGITVIDGKDNIQTNWTHTLDLNFENRIKETWDVRLGGRVSFTDAQFSLSSNNSRYFNTSYYTDLRYTPNDKWNFEVDANVVNHDAESFAEAIRIPILNARIDYYTKGEKMSIVLWAKDLLNENIGFRRISTANYLMQQEWNTIGRHIMLSVNWRIGS